MNNRYKSNKINGNLLKIKKNQRNINGNQSKLMKLDEINCDIYKQYMTIIENQRTSIKINQHQSKSIK